jgi:DNA invertase Pin-like site-specific DNA recombinase
LRANAQPFPLRRDEAIALSLCHPRDEIFPEEVNGKTVRNRPKLEKAIDQLGTGDTLVVAEWDRTTRSMIDGIDIIKRINDRGCLLKALDKPHLDLTTLLGRGFIRMSACASSPAARAVYRLQRLKASGWAASPSSQSINARHPAVGWKPARAPAQSPRISASTTRRHF